MFFVPVTVCIIISMIWMKKDQAHFVGTIWHWAQSSVPLYPTPFYSLPLCSSGCKVKLKDLLGLVRWQIDPACETWTKCSGREINLQAGLSEYLWLKKQTKKPCCNFSQKCFGCFQSRWAVAWHRAHSDHCPFSSPIKWIEPCWTVLWHVQCKACVSLRCSDHLFILLTYLSVCLSFSLWYSHCSEILMSKSVWFC